MIDYLADSTLRIGRGFMLTFGGYHRYMRLLCTLERFASDREHYLGVTRIDGRVSGLVLFVGEDAVKSRQADKIRYEKLYPWDVSF